MIAVHESDRFGFGSRFQHLGTALQLQVFDHGDDIPVREDIAVGVFDNTISLGHLFERPLVSAGDTLEVVFEGENLIHVAHRAGGGGHDWKKEAS